MTAPTRKVGTTHIIEVINSTGSTQEIRCMGSIPGMCLESKIGEEALSLKWSSRNVFLGWKAVD